MSIVDDFQSYLAAQGIVDGGTGWPSSRRFMHDGSAQLVVISEDGGDPPGVFKAGAVGDAEIRRPALQFMVRGAEGDGDGSRSKAQEIFDLLQDETGVTIGGADYLLITARTPQPIFTGFDDKNRPIHTVSFRCAVAAT